MRRMEKSNALLEESRRYLAAGVPTAIQGAFLPQPILADHAVGARVYDVDGNAYLDFVLGFGPLILGHAPTTLIEAVTRQLQRGSAFGAPYAALVELSRRVTEILPSVEMVRYNNSGSEAVQGALRVARAYTGREKIVKFEGHYHGWLDNIYVSHSPDSASPLGPPEAPNPLLSTAGQVPSVVGDLVILPWNDLEIVERTLKARAGEIAAVITEPIMANCGVIMPKPGYLEGLRRLTQEYGVLLIFDEVITGFRTSLAGAQGYYNVLPDLTVFAKAFGGGYPISGFGGRRDIMELIAQGRVVHAGTLNANPVVVAAALATINELSRDGGAPLERMRGKGQRLMKGLANVAEEHGIPMIIQGPGTFFGAMFGEHPLSEYRSTFLLNHRRAQQFYSEMLVHGVLCFPKGRGLWYLSTAHTDDDIDQALEVAHEVMPRLE